MFERRLRLFLLFVFLLGLVLAVRAAQVQVVDRGHWHDLAASNAEHVQYTPARRGDLLDFKGLVIAHDVARFDVAVNFRAIPAVPDADWLKDEARRRARLLPEYLATSDADARALIVAQETQRVRADLDEMWDAIAQITGMPRADIDARRREIADDVCGKQEAFWRRRYADALDAFEHAPLPPWYVRFIAGAPQKPDPDAMKHDSVIDDEEAFHTVVAGLAPDARTQITLLQDHVPQFRDASKRWQSVMVLRPAVQREYPFNDVAAHVIGHVGTVSAEDRDADPNKSDDRRRYSLVDRIGRDGIERLAEPQLRGTRGQRVLDRRGNPLAPDDPDAIADAGDPVKTTIDIELQRDIQAAFKTVDFQHPEKDAAGNHIHQTLSMNGAAVVIDIATGQVRALVSVPSYDLNHFDDLYAQLVDDEWNGPMRNRPLGDAVEPGSAVKPIVGLGAVTQHLITPTDTVRCEGYAYVDNKRVEKPRCWTESIYHKTHMTLGHPPATPDLMLADAIERSCNVYFLTVGNKLGIERLSYWMKQFGLGQITGIGLPESTGLLPSMARIPAGVGPSATWYASIGQGPVSATPIQIANEIATIARDGVWVRPRLLVDIAPPPTTRPDGSFIPDRVDLHLDPGGLEAVHRGMFAVVNAPAGTGRNLARKEKDLLIAAKTGSATAQPLSHPQRNSDGSYVRDADGNVLYERMKYGRLGAPNPDLPWYFRSGTNDAGIDIGTHSWVAGYAPADHPTIAFAVYVEYGGSGGIGAGSVANKLIQACIDHHYLTPDANAQSGANLLDTDAQRETAPINPED